MIARDSAVIAMTPTADHTDYEAYFVKDSSGNAALVTAADDDVIGVILHGEDTDGLDSILLLAGGEKCPYVKLSGTVSKFGLLQLAADATVTADAGSGARILVGRALAAGVADEKIPMLPFTPVKYTA